MNELNVGEAIIVNFADRPCARLIAEVVGFGLNGDLVKYKYLDKRARLDGVLVTPRDRARRVTDFGVILSGTHELLRLWVLPSGPSTVKYKDGNTREWQPEGNPDELLMDDGNSEFRRTVTADYIRERIKTMRGDATARQVLRGDFKSMHEAFKFAAKHEE